jgi:hypothetical protein
MTVATAISTNGDTAELSSEAPYIVEVTVEGTSPLLFHRWQDGAVAEKAAAAKGSKAKKTDNVESYVWRDTEGRMCLPGIYLIGSLVDPRNGAAKYRQDPRSPRKSALDLYRAGVVPLTDLAPITKVSDEVATTWDYLDSRRVTVQRSGVTRIRPAFLAGWRATIELSVLTPEYIRPAELLDCLVMAGRLVGVGDFRPMFGRYSVPKFEIVTLS